MGEDVFNFKLGMNDNDYHHLKVLIGWIQAFSMKGAAAAAAKLSLACPTLCELGVHNRDDQTSCVFCNPKETPPS